MNNMSNEVYLVTNKHCVNAKKCNFFLNLPLHIRNDYIIVNYVPTYMVTTYINILSKIQFKYDTSLNSDTIHTFTR